MTAEYTHLELADLIIKGFDFKPEPSKIHAWLEVYEGVTNVCPQRDILGLVWEGQLSINGRQPLKPRDIYTLKAGKIHFIEGGTALEISLDKKVQETKITRADDVPSKPGYTSGTIKVMKDDDEGNVHLIWVDNKANIKKPHYHLRFSEIYFVLEGSGRMQFELLEQYERTQVFSPEEVPVKPGSFVFIPPRIIHNSVSETGLVIQVVALPTLYKDDIHLI